jgi:hypothetical protein
VTVERVGWSLLVATLLAGGLALWWRYGEVIVLAEPAWMCLPR